MLRTSPHTHRLNNKREDEDQRSRIEVVETALLIVASSRNSCRQPAEADRYVCPNDKPLGRNLRKFKNKRTGVTKANTIIYRASKVDCEPCPLKARCCPKEPARKIHRSIHEDARDVARALATTEDYAQSRNDRKKVEMLFAHLKKIMRFERLRLRGPTGAQDEFCLAATVQNLRKLAKLVPASALEVPIVA